MHDSPDFLPLFLTHQADLRAFIGAVVRDPQTREDIFQNVSLTLWEAFDRYDPDRSFGAWARGIAAKKVLHEHRRHARFPLLLPPEAIQAVADAFDRLEAKTGPRQAALADCLTRLPAKTREILVLRYDSELSGETIALRTGNSLAAVHQTLSRARAALSDCIRLKLQAIQK